MRSVLYYMAVKFCISPGRKNVEWLEEGEVRSMFGREGDEVTRNGQSYIMRSDKAWRYLECAYNTPRTKSLIILQQTPSTVHIRTQA